MQARVTTLKTMQTKKIFHVDRPYDNLCITCLLASHIVRSESLKQNAVRFREVRLKVLKSGSACNIHQTETFIAGGVIIHSYINPQCGAPFFTREILDVFALDAKSTEVETF